MNHACSLRRAGSLLTIVLTSLLAIVPRATAGQPPDSSGAGGRLPNVLLVVLDALRADHLGCYGYARPTSPHIDSLAARADLYPIALSSSSWTLPSHASLFTGLHPFEHGAHSYPVDQPLNNARPLSQQQVTLAEVLRDEGYRTGAFVANVAFLNVGWQLDQGFQDYTVERRPARDFSPLIMDWLTAHRDEPFFLFLNFMDTHLPYNAEPRPGFLPVPAVKDNGELVQKLSRLVLPGEAPPPRELVQQVIDQYDTGLANVDEQVGLLLDKLIALGIDDQTLVVLTSDHGEFFGEHQLVEHCKDVYQEVLEVPLIIKRVGQTAGQVRHRITVSADIPYLILAECGLDGQACREHGFGRPERGSTLISQNYYTRVNDLFNPVWGWRFNRVRTAYFAWPYKYILSSDGRNELYDLEQDSREEHDLVTEQSERAAEMAGQLNGFLERYAPASEPVELPRLSKQERARLRSLGY